MKLQPYDFDNYPENPGVYRMLDNQEQILYIGKAKNLRKRLTDYFDNSPKAPRIVLMVSKIAAIEVTVTITEDEALVLEQKLINKIKPRYNVLLKDDKGYPFIGLSKHTYPRIFISREKHTKHLKDDLFGPYPRSDNAYHHLDYIQKAFQIRTCTDTEFAHRSRPCILHSIGKCSAPCTKKSETFETIYHEDVEQAKRILKGDIRQTIKSLKDKMMQHSDALEFEQAAKLRDTIQKLEHLPEKQKVYSTSEENLFVFACHSSEEKLHLAYARILDGVIQQIHTYDICLEEHIDITEAFTRYIEQEMKLQERLPVVVPYTLPELFHPHHVARTKNEKNWIALIQENLKVQSHEQKRHQIRAQTIIQRLSEVFAISIHSIDFIDISHFGGEATYGGKIRWSVKENRGLLDKPHYRLSRFDDEQIDDLLHMEQTVEKIYHTQEDMPSILIIDGDTAQMQAAWQGLKDKNVHTLLMCSAKGVSRKKGSEIFYIHPDSFSLIKEGYLRENMLELKKNDVLRQHIQFLQDTAHNFSNSARKKKMSKERFE